MRRSLAAVTVAPLAAVALSCASLGTRDDQLVTLATVRAEEAVPLVLAAVADIDGRVLGSVRHGDDVTALSIIQDWRHPGPETAVLHARLLPGSPVQVELRTEPFASISEASGRETPPPQVEEKDTTCPCMRPLDTSPGDALRARSNAHRLLREFARALAARAAGPPPAH